jgi:heterotetrameric sarcosine oxidase delta subunit
MRFDCPFCGERGLEEFAYHGDATVSRPRDGGEAPSDAWTDYVFEITPQDFTGSYGTTHPAAIAGWW